MELKAVGELSNGNVTQAMNYVKLYKMPIALLINFGGDSLTFKRIHNNEILNELKKITINLEVVMFASRIIKITNNQESQVQSRP